MLQDVSTLSKKGRSQNPNIRTIAFEILEKCNLYCDFCVRSASYKLEAMLTEEQFQERVNRVAATFPNLELVALTGGEPFLHPKIVDFVKIAKQCTRYMSITTNATMHKLPELKALADLKYCHLIISLDGPDASIHDFVRGKAGAFDGLVKFTQYCREFGLPFLMNMTVNEKNYQRVYETAQVAQSLGSQDLSVALVKPEGRGKAIEDNDAIFVEVGRQTMLAQRDFAAHGLKVRFTDPLAHIFDVRLSLPGVRRGCGANSGALHIQCNGTILICTSCKESLGKIDDESFDLGERSKDDDRICGIYDRKNLGGECGGCSFVEACGGCRCRAIPTEEGFTGPDPLCPKNVSPFKDSSTETVLQTALSKLLPKNARDSEALKEYLRDWKNAEKMESAEKNRKMGKAGKDGKAGSEDKPEKDGHRADKEIDLLSVKRWGHNMDLGGGRTHEGAAGWRHVDTMRRWLTYGTLPTDLSGKRVLDVMSGTGGTALLFAALGANAEATEENDHNRAAMTFLADQFSMPAKVVNHSIYNLAEDESREYDLISFIGSLSQHSDMLAALRIAFNHLKDGGKCLIETQTSTAGGGEDQFWGPSSPRGLWHVPSRLTLIELFRAAGFQKTVIVDFDEQRRIQLFGTRTSWQEMPVRRGLSITSLR